MSIRIGIQGLAASYSDAALLMTAPHATKVFCDSFSDAFQSLQTGKIDKALLPFENSTAGFIAENYQLLLSSGFQVTDEYLYRVEHCLLGPMGSSLADVQVVWSHPQALLQCSRFLKEHGLRTEPYFDTAGAARDITRSRGKAAVASARAAQLYGLEILKQSIGGEAENWTRFLTIEKTATIGRRLLVACDGGDLGDVLGSLHASSIKLISVLSQPITGETWGHRYFIEMQAENPSIWKEVLQRFRGLKVLGSFEGKR